MATRNIPALSMRATVSSVNEEARTVEVVWTTGEKVLRANWDGQFYEELSLDPAHVRMDRLTSGRAPFLANHSSRGLSDVLGVVESAQIGDGKGTAVIRFAKGDPDADKVWNKVSQRILPNVSVGYRIHKFEKVSGGASEIPTFRATDWEPYEVSSVPMGADSAAHVRSEDTDHPCEFPEEHRSMTAEELKLVEEKRQAELKAAADAAVSAERARVSGIRAAVRAASFGEDLAEKLVNENSTVEAARAVVLEKLAERSAAAPPSENGSHAKITDDASDKFARGVVASLISRSGTNVVREAKEKNLSEFKDVELDPGEFRGISLVDIARASLERRGVSMRGVYNKADIIKRALEYRAGAASTSDFPVLFENVLYKTMRAAYAVQAHTWRRFCGTDTVSDFRSAHRFMNGSFGTLPVVNEGGEYTNTEIPDGSKLSIATETRGQIIAVTRQMLINDDMGAMADLAVRFGTTAGRSIDAAVYDMLGLNSGLGPTMSDSQPYFHANRANVSTTAAISAAALDADRLKMRQQKDVSDVDYLDLTPSILLVPVGVETAAKILNADAYDPAQVGSKTNSARGLFTDIVSSPRLSWSATRRYLFTANKEAFKVVFLEGTGEAPVMETEESFRTDGLSWKVRIDFKVNAFDPKAAITNAG